jgi:hypothetical protein
MRSFSVWSTPGLREGVRKLLLLLVCVGLGCSPPSDSESQWSRGEDCGAVDGARGPDASSCHRLASSCEEAGRHDRAHGEPLAQSLRGRRRQFPQLRLHAPLDQPGGGGWGRADARFSVGSRVRRLDLRHLASCGDRLPPLALGHHTVTVTATDEAGNPSEPSSVAFRLAAPMSHYGWGCATSPTLPASGAGWVLMIWWLRRRGPRRLACPPGMASGTPCASPQPTGSIAGSLPTGCMPSRDG